MKTLKSKWLRLLLTAAALPLNSFGAAPSGPERGISPPDSTASTAEEQTILALSATAPARQTAAREPSSVQAVP